MEYVKIIVIIAIGLIIGSFNPAYLLAKIRGFDIRKSGSGNAGGSNAVITMGKKVGFACILLDIAKALISVRIIMWLFPTKRFLWTLMAASCIIGHMYPFYMGFKGGKGLACLGGSILALSPLTFVIMLSAELILAIAVDYICLVPITACIIFPVIYGLISKDIGAALLFLPASLCIIFKHIENLKRIRKGTELHFSYLWLKGDAKKQEEERVTSGR